MKRLAAAGTFALLAGGATLILVASIFYSCRQGGSPHNPRPDARSSSPSPSPPVVMHTDPAPTASVNTSDARRVTGTTQL